MSTSGHLKFQGTNRATFVGATSNIMFDTTSTSLGIGVTGTDHPSSNLYITGNAYVSSNIAVGGVLTMGTVNVVARHDLESVTATGNITPLTVEFTNPTTSIVASGNVEVTGNVVAGYLYGDGSNITGISSTLQAITDTGNVTSNTVQFSNAITSLTATSNIEVAGFVGSSGTGALTVPSGTTAEQPSTGLVGGMVRFNSTLNRLEVYNGTTWQGLGGVSATQSAGSGTTATIDGYRIHTFTSTGTFTVISSGEFDYLVVAGGGGGGSGVAGGGGAGGMLTGSYSLENNSYAITVGAGGVGGITNNTYRGDSGANSSISNLIVADGGGAGASAQSGGPGYGAEDGGSGGGGSYYSDSPNIKSGGSGTSGQGNNGGNSPSVQNGAGGGGAGQNGAYASSSGGNGGNGLQSSISGTNTYYAGGGGGGSNTTAGTGGAGGGGNGGVGANNGTDGTDGLGGGGGGGWNYSGGNGGAGGDGIVIIRYPI